MSPGGCPIQRITPYKGEFSFTSASEPTSRPGALPGGAAKGGLSWPGALLSSPITDWTDRESGLWPMPPLLLGIFVRLNGNEWNLFSLGNEFMGGVCGGGEAGPKSEDSSVRDFAGSSATIESNS